MEQTTQAEALLHASYLESVFISEEMSSSRANRIAKELRRLHAENERLSALCDKWNSECDEFREDNKRLAAEIQSMRASQQAERAVSAEPVATIKSWTNGSYWRNYSVVWHRDDLPVGTDLYLAAPVQQSAPAGDADRDALILRLVQTLENHQGNYKLSKSESAVVNSAIEAGLAAIASQQP